MTPPGPLASMLLAAPPAPLSQSPEGAIPFAVHEEPVAPAELWGAWHWDPWIFVPLLVTAGLYTVGLFRLWSRAGPGRGVRRWEAAAFLSGMLVLLAALVSPVHPLGGTLFSAHMIQHALLMVVAAPLLALGRAVAAMAWACPRRWRPVVASVTGARFVRSGSAALTHPVVAWAVFAVTVWVWHVPALYQATLTSEAVHIAQHVSFVAASLLFWMAAVEMGRRHPAGLGLGALYFFTTALHGSAFGALITFSRVTWYPAYEGRTEAWGLTALEDQQLGGLVMWGPMGLVLVAAALIALTSWLRMSEGRMDGRTGAREAPRPAP